MAPSKHLVDLTSKRFLVTGASSGIGRATAVLLSELGGDVLLTGRSEERLNATLSELADGDHFAVPFDLSEMDNIPTWILELAQKHGRLDGLVHMAGVHGARPLKVTDQEFVDHMFQVNISTAIGLAKGFRHKKVRGPNSSIVFASSAAAMVGEAGVSAYSASKGAIISLTRSLAMELARENVRVNCVSPSIVDTEMTRAFQTNFTPEQIQQIADKHPLGLGKPIDVAGQIAFLLSDAARWVTGTNVIIDGGYTAQ